MSDEDPIVNGTPLSTLRVVDLKEELDKHGLSKLGNKSVLADRLREFMLNGTRDSVTPTKSPQKDKSESPVKSPSSENPIVAAYRAKQLAALQEAQKEKAAETARTVSESGDSANVSFDENNRNDDSKEKADSDSEEEDNGNANNGDEKLDETLRESSTSSPRSETASSETNDENKSQNGSKVEAQEATTNETPENIAQSSKPEEKKEPVETELHKKESTPDNAPNVSDHTEPKVDEVVKEQSGEQEELELDYGEAEEVEPEKDEVFEDKPIAAKEPTEKKEIRKTEKHTRQVSPCRYPEDSVIIIRGLMRPYTLPQLKNEITSEGGEIVDFWIDDKRSHCIVEMRSVEQAKEVRKRMRGAKWPVSSQRTLSVHFDNKQNLERHKSGLVGTDKSAAAPATTSRTISNDQDRPKLSGLPGRNLSLRMTLESAVRDNSRHDQEKTDRLVEGRREKETKREVEKRNVEPSRTREEPDRKRRRSVTPPRERKRERLEDTKHVAKERIEKEQPKSADELFMKTKTSPHIYYLPATEEEAKLRTAKREADAKREAERASRRR